jgi:AmmeMemoRadiSam system protein A
MLSESERIFLLTAARNALTCAVLRTPARPVAAPTRRLAEPSGAFVSLHLGGELRGCIGYIDPVRPLLMTVEEAACKAGTEDVRFAPVTAAEVALLEIEISVLSHPEPFHEPGDIEIGTHGVLIETRHRRGLLLPQVALEFGWDQTMLLNHTAEKAGLPRNAWKLPDVKLYRFTAEIFHECAPGVER